MRKNTKGSPIRRWEGLVTNTSRLGSDMQQAEQVYCRETGKMKNCNAWAEYEQPHTSETSKMCHGGFYKQQGWLTAREYPACPSRAECKQATQVGVADDGRRRLPILNPGSASRPLSPAFSVPEYRTSGLPSTLPARAAQVAQRAVHDIADYFQAPRPIQPPPEYPASMQTPYVPATEGWGAPTFLPRVGESVWERLVKNLVQAVFAVVGFQIYNYMRSIDLFRSV